VGVAQGWDADPWGHYEQRWFSQGNPTSLVRTHGVEARDEPDAAPPAPEPAPSVELPPAPVRASWRVPVRRRPVRARLVLTAAMVIPVLGCVLLVPVRGDRVFVVGAFALVFVSLAALVWGSPRASGSSARLTSRT
jgi:hypothetical protein